MYRCIYTFTMLYIYSRGERAKKKYKKVSTRWEWGSPSSPLHNLAAIYVLHAHKYITKCIINTCIHVYCIYTRFRGSHFGIFQCRNTKRVTCFDFIIITYFKSLNNSYFFFSFLNPMTINLYWTIFFLKYLSRVILFLLFLQNCSYIKNNAHREKPMSMTVQRDIKLLDKEQILIW